AALGAALAFRPIRRGTPPRDPAVIQTQIVLAVIGAIIMLVVGASLARAFGIVGAASLVRYRAKIGDPKDAAVMLGALAIGLASGVGIYLTAAIGTVFVLLILWALESFEPVPKRAFLLVISGKEVDEMRGGVEKLLRENRIRFDLRTGGQEELAYDVELPARRRTERLTDAILALDTADVATVEWRQEKKK
ncbi:MAG: MgtC/SapB family protein, partial [Gemmatimonadota bacterium]|nr:MgtC/SapB family protein [Gemmatimonadota bacterium]